MLIPGVIDTCTNYIEHPELVAQRIGQFADIVGRERVIAGTDCGFATFVGHAGRVDPELPTASWPRWWKARSSHRMAVALSEQGEAP